jgi:hypothetical protein
MAVGRKVATSSEKITANKGMKYVHQQYDEMRQNILTYLE